MSDLAGDKELEAVTCELCGAVIPNGEENFDDEGRVICADCEEQQGVCPTCGGSGGGDPPFVCPSCHGTGEASSVKEDPDDARDEDEED